MIEGNVAYFPPPKKETSHVVWPFMHSCIKSIATRENRLCVSATQQRLTALIAKVIKPINVVLCAACHWVDGTLSFCWAFHEPCETEKKKVHILSTHLFPYCSC